MMRVKYQLVAYTRNIADKENARLYLTPSLESEVQASLFNDLSQIRKEEYKCHEKISINLARRIIRTYRNMSRFKILTGHSGNGIRYLFFAAWYCIMEDGNRAYYMTYQSSHSHLYVELRHEFASLCEEAVILAQKHGLEHILKEAKPKRILELYKEHTQRERDLE